MRTDSGIKITHSDLAPILLTDWLHTSTQDNMTDQTKDLKNITVRVPEEFWDRAKMAVHAKRTTLQQSAIDGMCLILNLDPPLLEAALTAQLDGERKAS